MISALLDLVDGRRSFQLSTGADVPPRLDARQMDLTHTSARHITEANMSQCEALFAQLEPSSIISEYERDPR
jgi:hypothetical protein